MLIDTMKFLKLYAICPVNGAALEAAANLAGGEFEDNLQMACATLTGLDAIVTRHQKGFSHSTILVLEPAGPMIMLNHYQE